MPVTYKFTTSPFYSSPTLYHFLMRMLYGKNFDARYQVIADEIPDGASVVDVCAGDAYLYTKFLIKKNIRYTALDNSPFFLRWAQKKGLDYRKINVFFDEFPKADVVVMMASLCQFIPKEKEIVQKLIQSARQKVLLSEPISNLSSSHIQIIARISQRLTTPFEDSGQYAGKRFDEEQMVSLLKSFPGFKSVNKIPGGREIVGVIAGEG
jgi:hypothetical protein